ncbi:hypothetical protein [Microbacterium sp. RURRCA19A]|uniref:hypothetical protein n=1 Tax=Microbacterium sp. RURRCA19A TaxID=1907391 RepID=UPI0009539DE6|nr:hypothetical protein [Microbacterium sp. RURRCA19A]SIS08517.1 hypothetical protein SAMN05880568_2631 [Microbacterium sp. RURRCA19A]
MLIRTTSTQRTYRYVRLTILAATLLLAVAVAVEEITGGPLPSLSAAYYTPAGPMFVAGLCVVAAAFVALSGRSVEQGLLDVAAVLALVIAVVPTTVESPACGQSVRCVPPAVVPAVVNNGVAVASVVFVGVVAGLALSIVQRTISRGVVLTASAITLLAGGFVVWGSVSPTTFLPLAHNAAAVGFFLLIGAVAVIAAWRPQRAPRRFRPAYAAVAVGILIALAGLGATLVAAIAGVDVTRPVPWVFLGESLALVLFAVFWFLQTVELWNEPDPRLRT